MHKTQCFLFVKAIAPVSASEPRSSTRIVDTSLKRFCFAKPSQIEIHIDALRNPTLHGQAALCKVPTGQPSHVHMRHNDIIHHTYLISSLYSTYSMPTKHKETTEKPVAALPSGIGPTVWLLEGPMPIFKSSLVNNTKIKTTGFYECYCENGCFHGYCAVKFTGPRCKNRGVNWIDERTLALCALNKARCIKQRLGSESSDFGIKTREQKNSKKFWIHSYYSHNQYETLSRNNQKCLTNSITFLSNLSRTVSSNACAWDPHHPAATDWRGWSHQS